jgi:hypothetical protein
MIKPLPPESGLPRTTVLLNSSSLKVSNCRRRYNYVVAEGLQNRDSAEALTFGKAVHRYAEMRHKGADHGLRGWHIDHIVPCASFNLMDVDEQKRCFHYTNLQALWAKANISKGAKIVRFSGGDRRVRVTGNPNPFLATGKT